MNSIARFTQRPRLAPVYAGLAHAARLLSTLVIIKLIAVYVGPEGLARLGFFMSLASIVAVFAGGGIANGVIKFVAEYRGSPVRVVRFLGCAVLYGGVFSLAVLGLSLIFVRPLAGMVFGEPGFWWMMPIFGLAQLLAFIGVMTVSTANGLGRQDIFAGITLSAYLGAIAMAYPLISRLGMEGGALALAMVTASVGCVSLVVIARSGILRVLRPRYRRETFAKFFRFSLMMVSAAAFFPITEILIRAQIIAELGLEVAGFWQGLIRLSGAYIGFFSVFLATTFMPRLSGTEDMYGCRRLVLQQLPLVGGAFAVCAVGIYLLREQVVLFVFSTVFLPLADVILWQLLGDLFRVCSYVIGFLLVAKTAARLYICAEFLQFGMYLAVSLLIIAQGGQLAEIAQGYALSYGIYLAVMLVLLFGFTRRHAS